MAWKNINIQSNLIEHETSRAFLFNLPKNSDYKGYKFWHPAKCIRSGRHSAAVSIGFTDDWNFKFIKTDRRGNLLDEIEISSKEFEEIFDKMDKSIIAKRN